jgi:hypothetical protein
MNSVHGCDYTCESMPLTACYATLVLAVVQQCRVTVPRRKKHTVRHSMMKKMKEKKQNRISMWDIDHSQEGIGYSCRRVGQAGGTQREGV